MPVYNATTFCIWPIYVHVSPPFVIMFLSNRCYFPKEPFKNIVCFGKSSFMDVTIITNENGQFSVEGTKPGQDLQLKVT